MLRWFTPTPPASTPEFPTDLTIPFLERPSVTPWLPAWVYQALECERLVQMQARVAPYIYSFERYALPDVHFLGWKLGSTQFEAPTGYGHPECVLDTYWVACHLTPEVVQDPCVQFSPVGPNLVQRLSSAQQPDSPLHQGVSVDALLPTHDLQLGRWTDAGEIFRSLRPQTYPDQMSTGECVVLSGAQPALCLADPHRSPNEQLHDFWYRLRRVREARRD